MKRRHPNSLRAILAIALVVCAIVPGCRNQSGGIGNPFLAPNRVPPPSTRMIAPGTAQPYYPGDPLPVMQSSTQAPGAAVAGAAAGTQWKSPIAPTNGTPASAAPTPSPPVAFSNEPSVAVPSDSESLRFALPSPPPAQEPAPITPVTDATPLPTNASASPTAAAAPTSGVIPAAYNQPANAAAPSSGILPGATTAAATSNAAWRSPQVAPTSQSQPGQPYYGVPGQPVSPAVAPSSMGVQLRAVPSPAPEPVDATTPRIRLPGYPTPATTSGVPVQPQANGYYTVAPAAAGNAVQIVPLQSPWDGTMLPAYGAQPAGAGVNVATQGQPSTLSTDGFRPRSTAK